MKLDRDIVWGKMESADQVAASKGRNKVLTWAPNESNRDEILSEVIGRSGNLRAPTLLVNGRFLVGFNQALYDQSF